MQVPRGEPVEPQFFGGEPVGQVVGAPRGAAEQPVAGDAQGQREVTALFGDLTQGGFVEAGRSVLPGTDDRSEHAGRGGRGQRGEG
ncbi:hypothetical protein ALMP_06350 [Streptomyces sp. A012304]|nr:hypothetical protein ALMP_06350 [Streptomyces sp. A012304]